MHNEQNMDHGVELTFIGGWANRQARKSATDVHCNGDFHFRAKPKTNENIY